MTSKKKCWIKPARTLFTTIACTAILSLATQAAFAQAGDKIRKDYPQLADLFNAFDVTQAQTFETIVAINAQPAYGATRMELREQLESMKKMTLFFIKDSDCSSIGVVTLATGSVCLLERV